ncbi:hypothetical protein FHG87_016404 [Trinorchestia longiramus]|nr:hypothetical protein FHG87_016404 [Trinorchestia longiramus]
MNPWEEISVGKKGSVAPPGQRPASRLPPSPSRVLTYMEVEVCPLLHVQKITIKATRNMREKEKVGERDREREREIEREREREREKKKEIEREREKKREREREREKQPTIHHFDYKTYFIHYF